MMIFRLALKVSALLLVICAVCVGVMTALRDDLPDFEALLQPSAECEGTCVMGVAFSTAREFAAQLEAHEWVAFVDPADPPTANTAYVTTGEWRWNGQQPGYVADDGRGVFVVTGNGLVVQVKIDTEVSVGEVWLALGQPYSTVRWINSQGGLGTAYYYPIENGWLIMETRSETCDLSMDAHLRQAATIVINARISEPVRAETTLRDLSNVCASLTR